MLFGYFKSQVMCLRAQSLRAYPTLCDPMDCSPPGSSLHGVLQARMLEWGEPCPPPGGLPRPELEPTLPVPPALQADSSCLSHQGSAIDCLRPPNEYLYFYVWICFSSFWSCRLWGTPNSYQSKKPSHRPCASATESENHPEEEASLAVQQQGSGGRTVYLEAIALVYSLVSLCHWNFIAKVKA